MAAVIRCERCGVIVNYNKAMHIRAYKMQSPTTYASTNTLTCFDLCNECYKEVIKDIKLEDQK